MSVREKLEALIGKTDDLRNETENLEIDEYSSTFEVNVIETELDSLSSDIVVDNTNVLSAIDSLRADLEAILAEIGEPIKTEKVVGTHIKVHVLPDGRYSIYDDERRGIVECGKGTLRIFGAVESEGVYSTYTVLNISGEVQFDPTN